MKFRNTKTCKRTYTIKPNVYEWLKIIKNDSGISLSWLVNTAVERYLEENYDEEDL